MYLIFNMYTLIECFVIHPQPPNNFIRDKKALFMVYCLHSIFLDFYLRPVFESL